MMYFSNLQHLWWLIPVILILAGGFYYSLVDRPKLWKWLSFGCRVLAVILLVLGLCKPFQRGDAENVHVAFLVDGSASVSAEGIRTSVEKIQEGIDLLDSKDSYSIQLFDSSIKTATLEELGEFADTIERDGAEAQTRASSDIASALLATRMKFGADKAKKIVLFSDGVATDNAIDQPLEILRDEEVSISFHKIAPLKKTEVAAVEFKSLVPTAFEGEIVRMEGRIATNKEMEATVRLLNRGIEVQKQQVQLKTNESNIIGFEVEMYTAGDTRWTMEVETKEDYFLMNNVLSTTVQVSGKPRVLAIHKDPKEMRSFARALRKQGIELDVRGAKGLPSSLEELLAFRAVLLCNVAATDLTVKQMFDLKRYVADMGGGLGMLGSENSFGIGGYHNTPVDEILPIASRYEKEKIKPSLAMALVIDKSGSMSGQPIQLARQAARSAVELLGAQDSIAVIGFDSEAQTIVQMSSAANKGGIKDSIDTLAAGGGTNLFPGLLRAQEMLDATPAKIKHVIILSDGQTAGQGYEELVGELVASRVTVSTVALGQGAAKDLMKALAELGNGRYYETDDPQSVPQIFTKETMQASKSAIKEDLFESVHVADHPMLNGFEKAELPFIMGYVMTQPRPTAKVLLATEVGDPLLATNRFGLGQTFAYSSDLTEKWGSEWLSWSACGQFWNQVIRSVLRKEDGRGIQASSDMANEELNIRLTRRDDAGNLVNRVKWRAEALDESRNVQVLKLAQTGVGTYSAKIPLIGKDRLLIQLTDTADGNNKTVYWRRGYPAEFLLDQKADSELMDLAEDSMEEIRQNMTNGIVEKDKLALFAFLALILSITGILLRRI